ncbi:CAP domain-containing protein [Sulfurovum sp.]|uniref:CAP domain-containing protein n=1 Tax=Sulfurovum sp. TaxID=1969726 RepID=UPI0025E04231|nr:CAP domain-containing protein [Sulfurovum sp.]
MKKIYIPILAALLFVGCGGGSTNTADATNETGETTPSTSITVENSTNEPNTTSPDTFFNAPLLTQSEKQDYLDAINDARRVQRDCGRVIGIDAEGKEIKVYDGTDIMPSVGDLVWNDGLYSAAAEHSKDLAAWNNGIEIETEARKRFSHDGSGTTSDWTSQKLELGRGSTVSERGDNNGYIGFVGENITAGTNTDTEVDAVNKWLSSPGHCKNMMDPNYKEVGMAVVEDADSFYTYYWTQNLGVPQ